MERRAGRSEWSGIRALERIDRREEAVTAEPRDWTASTIEDGVSDAFVFFRGLTTAYLRDRSLEGWERWLDARDAGTETPRWEDMTGWERFSIDDVSLRVLRETAFEEDDLRLVPVVWRFYARAYARGSDPPRFLRWLQNVAIRLAGPDPGDPLRDKGWFAADGSAR